MAAPQWRDPPRAAAIALLIAASALGCRAFRAPMHPDSPPGRWYVVEAGDTLGGLARRAGVPAEDILEINGLSRADDVRPGRLIYLLAPPAAAAVAAAEVGDDAGPPPGLRWPLAGVPRVPTSPFGDRDGRRHEGIDLPAPTGTPVFAAADGRVVYAGNTIRGYGNLIVLKHRGGLLTVYAHGSLLLVSEGQQVRAGDRIALVGQSGRATGPHLHFEVRAGQIPRDPMLFLPLDAGTLGGSPLPPALGSARQSRAPSTPPREVP